MATRLFAKGADHILAFLSKVTIAVALALIVFAAAPNVGVAIPAHSAIVAAFAILAPGILATLSLATPPPAPPLGFPVAPLGLLPGLVNLHDIGWMGAGSGLR